MAVANDIMSRNKYITPVSFTIYDADKNGYASAQIDCGGTKDIYHFPAFDAWDFAGKGNYSSRHDRIKPTPPVLYIEGVPLRIHFPVETDTSANVYTTHKIYIGPINRFGHDSYKAYNNTYSGLRDFLWENGELRGETLSRLESRVNKGLTPKKGSNPVFGIGVSHDDSLIAAYYPNQRYLVTHIDFHNRIRKLAAEYGISNDPQAIRALARSIFAHEAFDHGVFEIGDERNEHRFIGLLESEFQSDRAEKHEGTKWAKIYRTLASIHRDFADSFSFWQEIKNEIQRELYSKGKTPHQQLVEHLFEVADALEVPPSEKLKYVKGRLQHLYGELWEEEPSPLERIVDESDKASYRNMKDVRDREVDAKEAPKEAEAEANAEAQ